jgi:PIN domain nuclease of toxin-antitoxin system
VLDTHAWLWSVNAPRKLSRDAIRAIDRADRVAVSAISVLELVDLVERRKIALAGPGRAWVREALEADRVVTLPVTADLALDAAQLRFASDPFDRVIYATARAEEAQLVTRDERLHAFDPARAVW